MSGDAVGFRQAMSRRQSAQSAFEHYVVPEIPVLLRVARALTRHDAEAEDLVQDTVLRAFRAIDSFDGRYPRSWLLTIMRNTHINRHRRRRPELLRDPDATLAVAALEGLEEHSMFDDIFDAEVERALDALSPAFRAVVEHVDVQGLSYAETATELGVPVGTVMSRLHRARRRMRADLERAGIRPRSTT